MQTDKINFSDTPATGNNQIELKVVAGKKDLKEFIRLPWKLHKNHDHWVPPIYIDEMEYFNPAKNHALQYCDTVMLLCYKNNEALGRIMGIINHRYNEYTNTMYGRFSMLDCINDQQILNTLLNYLEEWAFKKGMGIMIGPMGMYYHDPMGFLIDGFEHSPAVSTYSNFKYLPDLVEKAGYFTNENLVVYKIDMPDQIPEFYERIYQRISQKATFSVRSFKSKKEMRKAIIPVLTLMNECFTEIYGYSQLDPEEMKSTARKFIIFLNPQLVKVAYHDNEPVGFIIAMPNICGGLRACKGFLFPFGFIKILRTAKKSTQLDLLIGGIKKKYQGLGIDVLLGREVMETARRMGFKTIDSHLELEKNFKMRAEMEKMGGKVYKRYRIYQKVLS